MTAREFLNQYDEANRKANRLRTEYEKEMLLIDAIRSASDNDGMPHSSGISKPTEDRAIRLADKAMQWKMAELDAIQIRQQVFDMISDIDGLAGEVLYNRYIELLKPWVAVAKKMNVSLPTAKRHHKKGLSIVQEKIDTL